MSIIESPVQESPTKSLASSSSLASADRAQGASASRVRQPRKQKSWSSGINMALRRIHLFSGLFMLPWVLLYGFTALLFNHPQVWKDSRTETTTLEANAVAWSAIPSAAELAREIAAQLSQPATEGTESATDVQLINEQTATFTQRATATWEGAQTTGSLSLDLNRQTATVRSQKKQGTSATEERGPTSLAEGPVKIQLDSEWLERLQSSVNSVPGPWEDAANEMRFTAYPTLEFDALVNGQPQRLRFTTAAPRGGRGRSESPATGKTPPLAGTVIVVGTQPREMSWRNYLLRLHMAHGYPQQLNARWFWAIAVDLMFASMCFWGLSGVVMWWQIKRTRRWGFLLLTASAVLATWLAIGMHWQMVHG